MYLDKAGKLTLKCDNAIWQLFQSLLVLDPVFRGVSSMMLMVDKVEHGEDLEFELGPDGVAVSYVLYPPRLSRLRIQRFPLGDSLPQLGEVHFLFALIFCPTPEAQT